MTEPTWSADDAYAVLRDSLDRYLAGEVSPTRLHSWLTAGYGVPPGTDKNHPSFRLWQLVVIDTAVFAQCDFTREELDASIRYDIDMVEGRSRMTGMTKLMMTPCFVQMVKSQTVPAPMINFSARLERDQLKADGFREI